jgi:hypothetical protein
MEHLLLVTAERTNIISGSIRADRIVFVQRNHFKRRQWNGAGLRAEIAAKASDAP